MKRFLPFFICAPAAMAAAAAPVELKDALAKAESRCEITAVASDCLSLSVKNAGALPFKIAIPAGAVFAGPEGTAHMIVLQNVTLAAEPASTAEALLPAALLSSTKAPPAKNLRLVEETEKRLDHLLKRLAGEEDLPRTTAQLMIFCLLEDMNFAGWQKFLATQRGPAGDKETHPTPAEIAQAIDALGLLREIAPERAFALMADGELKLRALRNPWCRAKAMQIYGIKVADDGSEFGLPNMSQLLHTKPGDNCPVCRNRAEMQKGASDF